MQSCEIIIFAHLFHYSILRDFNGMPAQVYELTTFLALKPDAHLSVQPVVLGPVVVTGTKRMGWVLRDLAPRFIASCGACGLDVSFFRHFLGQNCVVDIV